MEEVDKIIIDSLKHLGCDIGDDIETLKDFDPDMIVMAISSCLASISPNSTLPKKLPPAMIARLKIASDFAEHIKQLGFRGDMGYQTILYCNEVEVRRVLMFLIERLPRESTKIVPIEQTGYVPRIVKEIEKNLKASLKQIWVPAGFIAQGVRLYEDGYTVSSFGNSVPLESYHLDIPDPNSDNEVLKQYGLRIFPEVTKQCSPKTLIPSLLFKDTEFPRTSVFSDMIQNQKENFVQNLESKLKISNSEENIVSVKAGKQENVTNEQTITEESKGNVLAKKVEDIKSLYVALQEEIKNNESKLSQLLAMKNEEQDMLKNKLSKIKLKTKTLTIMNKEENREKLKNLVENASDRLIELANQWNEVQTPLLNEYKTLQGSLTSVEAKIQEETQKLEEAKQIRIKLTEDLKEKIQLEQNLIEKCKQMDKNNSRSAYTQRILEIIGNISKQNNEIQKVLKDTRDIQKEINNITGQVDRSFTLSDELIFHDAKNDETARKAYKLLAALRDECGSILKSVNEFGKIERESRNLQDQIDNEKAKDIAGKLDRVCADLAQIRKETKSLIAEN